MFLKLFKKKKHVHLAWKISTSMNKWIFLRVVRDFIYLFIGRMGSNERGNIIIIIFTMTKGILFLNDVLKLN